MLYGAFRSDFATQGSDLFDIQGKVEYIGINGAADDAELAAITDPELVTALVDMVLTAAIDALLPSGVRRASSQSHSST